ncbi:MAG TPA: MOSC N-terminal beta barrel domain-containing protein, partial [Cyclobacteriaceae bacterium]|nr:MOSC N-terminal beta barrel domain-containing protein [Cyclobacteriaceae bacterium]
MLTYRLEEIWIYPVKSLGGIRLPSAKVMEKGLQYDRRYMLVDESNKFITQRAFPLMSQFKLE